MRLRIPGPIDALIFALVFTPMLLLALMTGKITELSGFGLSAKAGQIARAPVSSLNLSSEKFKIQELTSDKPDFDLAAYFESCADYFVVKPSQIPAEEVKLAHYIAFVTYAVRSSIACGRLSGLVVLDDSDRYLGSYDRKFFVESTSVWAVPTSGEPLSAKELSERIQNMTIFGASLQYPRERITSGEGFEAAINVDAIISEAFDVFKKLDVEFLVLTDSLGRFQGIVRYKDIVEEVLSILMNK